MWCFTSIGAIFILILLVFAGRWLIDLVALCMFAASDLLGDIDKRLTSIPFALAGAIFGMVLVMGILVSIWGSNIGDECGRYQAWASSFPSYYECTSARTAEIFRLVLPIAIVAGGPIGVFLGVKVFGKSGPN